MNGLGVSPRRAARSTLGARGASFCLAVLATALVLALLVAIGIVPLLPNGEGQPAIAAFDVVAPQPAASPMPVVTPPTAKRQRPQKPDDKPTTTKEVTIRPDAAAARPEAVDLTQSLIPADDLSALIAGRGAGEGFRRRLQPVNPARVVVDRDAQRGVQTRVRVADLAPRRDLAERPGGSEQREKRQEQEIRDEPKLEATQPLHLTLEG